MTGWEFLVAYEPGIRKLAAKYAKVDGRFSRELADYMWDEAVDRVPELIDAWDESIGVTRWGYARSYLWRWFVKARLRWRRQLDRVEPLCAKIVDELAGDEVDQSARDEALYLLGAIDQEHRDMLIAKHWGNLTLQQIADRLEISKGSAVARYGRALEAARERVEGRTESQ
jgi:DNA-directed RNA polymerase specialized sigma24 family protein